mmetsp:Transcript_14193/g.27245  ORF Transcript_14193/g.27245 Transcript_14193/m.27245 type:complete len:201 (-) Transcript_14193:361-963(-)
MSPYHRALRMPKVLATERAVAVSPSVVSILITRFPILSPLPPTAPRLSSFCATTAADSLSAAIPSCESVIQLSGIADNARPNRNRASNGMRECRCGTMRYAISWLSARAWTSRCGNTSSHAATLRINLTASPKRRADNSAAPCAAPTAVIGQDGSTHSFTASANFRCTAFIIWIDSSSSGGQYMRISFTAFARHLVCFEL